MTLPFIFFELAVGLIILGALLALNRSVGERVCIFCAVIVSYVIAFAVTKIGLFDGLAYAIVKILSMQKTVGALLSSSALVGGGARALLLAAIRPIAMTFVFLLLCIVFRIIIAIVIKAAKLDQKVAFFRVAPKGKIGLKILACAIGALSCYSFFMLAYLPVSAAERALKPVAETVREEEYDGTLVQEVIQVVDKNLMPTGGRSPFGALQRYTAFEAILNGTTKSLSTVRVKDADGKRMKVDAGELWQGLISCAADGAAIYEFTCHLDDHTLGDMKVAAHLTETLSEQKLLLEIGEAYLASTVKDQEQTEKAGGLMEQLKDLITENYTGGEADALSADLKTVTELINGVTEDLGDTGLRKGKLFPALFAYLSEEESAYKVINTASHLTVYEGAFDIVAEYGIGILCDKLEISADKQAYYEDYMESLYAAVNTRTDGDYYVTEVESFIRYAIKSGINVSEYTIADPENLTEIDFAYMNYSHYFSQASRLEELFVGYTLDDKNALTVYTMTDGTVCLFDEKAGTWSEAVGGESMKAGSLAAQLLALEIKAMFAEDMGRTISKDDIRLLGARLIAQLETEGSVPASRERCASAALLLKSFLSADSFSPESTVYRDEIIQSLRSGAGFDAQQNEHMVVIVSTAALLGEGVSAKDAAGIELYINNFHHVGKLLDNMRPVDKTSAIPEKMLYAIAQHKDYGKYFPAESVKEMAENVESGASTYEELFLSVQALYNIANQILPTDTE